MEKQAFQREVRVGRIAVSEEMERAENRELAPGGLDRVARLENPFPSLLV